MASSPPSRGSVRAPVPVRRRRPAAGALVAALVAALACRPAPPPPPAAGEEVVVRVEGAPVLREEVERLAAFLALCLPNHAIDTLRQRALLVSLLPRALMRARHPAEEAAAKERIERAAARLEAGEAFDAVAAELSDDPEARRGDMGWLAVGDLDPLLGVEVFEAKVGEVRGPIPTRVGWHLLRVSERQEDPRAWRTAVHLHQIVARISTDPEFDRGLQAALREDAVLEPVDREFFERARPPGLRVRVAGGKE